MNDGDIKNIDIEKENELYLVLQGQEIDRDTKNKAYGYLVGNKIQTSRYLYKECIKKILKQNKVKQKVK